MTAAARLEPTLPGVLGEIAAVAGRAAALAIAEARGGTSVYFPPAPKNDHWLCRLIGREAAREVCKQLTCGVGPIRVELPLGPTGQAAKRRARVDAMIGEGRSERDIALATGYTTRGIRMRREKLARPEDLRQLRLI